MICHLRLRKRSTFKNGLSEQQYNSQRAYVLRRNYHSGAERQFAFFACVILLTAHISSTILTPRVARSETNWQANSVLQP